MRIVLVSVHTSPAHTPGQGDAGGLNVVMREASMALSRRGHEVTLVTRAPDTSPISRTPLINGDPQSPVLITLPLGGEELTKHSLTDILDDMVEAMLLLPEVRQADVLHSHYWLSGIVGVKVASLLGTRHALTFHTVAAEKNTQASHAGREPEDRVHAECLLARTTFMIAGSHSELDAVTRGYGQPTGSRVIHPGVDTDLFYPATHSSSTLRTRPRMTVLGRVQPFKGQDLALDAFAAACAAHPRLAQTGELVIAGEPTPGEQAFHRNLQQSAQSATLPVTFLPSQTREEAATLLRSSTLVIVPSLAETFGLVALEAQASGVPVIASDTTGLREAVIDGQGGVLVSGRDPQVWGSAILRLLKDDALYARLSTGAREFAVQHDWDAHARALIEVYAGLPLQQSV